MGRHGSAPAGSASGRGLVPPAPFGRGVRGGRSTSSCGCTGASACRRARRAGCSGARRLRARPSRGRHRGRTRGGAGSTCSFDLSVLRRAPRSSRAARPALVHLDTQVVGSAHPLGAAGGPGSAAKRDVAPAASAARVLRAVQPARGRWLRCPRHRRSASGTRPRCSRHGAHAYRGNGGPLLRSCAATSTAVSDGPSCQWHHCGVSGPSVREAGACVGSAMSTPTSRPCPGP